MTYSENPLFQIQKTDINYLKGVGPKRGAALKKNGISNIGELLRHYPRRYLDRTTIKLIKDLRVSDQAVIIGNVVDFNFKKTFKRNFFQVVVDDGTGTINCLWFNGVSWISDKFERGDTVAIFGKIEYRNGYSIIHPEFDKIDDSQKIILSALDKVQTELLEYYPKHILKQENLISINSALKEIHDPKDSNSLSNAIHRIKFDEHFFFQLLMALRKRNNNTSNGRIFDKKGDIVKRVYSNLNFELTSSQINVLREIRADLSSSKTSIVLTSSSVLGFNTFKTLLPSLNIKSMPLKVNPHPSPS